MAAPRILVVEDDEEMSGLVERGLTAEGYEVTVVTNGMDALIAASTGDYAAATIDVMMPEMTGFEICRHLRTHGSSLPVLLVTARDAVEDRVFGLDSGADDYLTKPFAMPELDARIGALLRRTASGTGVNLGNTSLSSSSLTLTVGSETATLTEHEARILELMMRTPERVFSRADIESHLYGWETPNSNSVEVRISQLRKKLEGVESDLRIRTIRNVGYVLQA